MIGYRPTYKIIIGKYVFDHCNTLEIVSDRRQLADTCIIKMPLHYKKEQLNKVVNANDPVEVYIAYNGDFREKPHFKGYIVQAQPGIPYAIRCEDEMWQLKRQVPQSKTFTKTPLKDIIKYLVPDVKANVPDVTPDQFIITKKNNVAWYLQKIKETYGFDIYYRNNQLFVGFPYTDTSAMGTEVFNLQRNVINDSLRFRSADDTRLRIRAVSLLPNNSKYEYYTGDTDGELRTWHEYNVTKSQLKLIAEEKLKQFKHDSYGGQFLTFGEPHIEHGMIADITNEWFDMQHKVFVDCVTTKGGVGGFRQYVNTGRIAG